MYRRFYRLTDGPFGLTPDPKYLFLAASHKEALASVAYGIQERKGFVLILGEVGTGKTTLVRHILKQFGDKLKVVYVFNTCTSFEELLRLTLREFDVPCASGERREMVDALNDFLLAEAAAGRYVVMIIDEAQHLSVEILEEIRMLSNLETASGKLLQLILVGQPELGEKLAQTNLRQLRQRIALVAELKPLSHAETAGYVGHRLKIAGYTGTTLFTRRALRRIHRESEGLPRLVNVLCDKALLLGYAAGAKRIGTRLVTAAGKDREVFRRPGARDARAAWRITSVLALGTVAALGILAWAASQPNVAFRLRASGSGVSGHQAAAVAPTAQAQAASVAEPAPAPRAAMPAPSVPPREAAPLVRVSPSDLGSSVVVVPGDRLATLIDRAYGRVDLTLLDVVKEANPGLGDVDVIDVGQQLRLPALAPESMVLKAGGDRYAVHLATVATATDPQLAALRAATRRAGVGIDLVSVHLAEGLDAYRVVAGSFRDRSEAEAFASRWWTARRSRAGR